MKKLLKKIFGNEWYCNLFHTCYATKDNKWYCNICNNTKSKKINDDYLGIKL